jgi:hypothetical protein
LGLTTGEIIKAIEAQNVQAAVGRIGARPISNDQQLQLNIQTKGRLDSVKPIFYVRRAKARSLSGGQTHPATFASAGSNRSSRGGDETAEAFDVKGHCGGSASMRAATSSERRAGSEKGDVEADPTVEAGKAVVVGEVSETCTQRFHRGIGGGTYA